MDYDIEVPTLDDAISAIESGEYTTAYFTDQEHRSLETNCLILATMLDFDARWLLAIVSGMLKDATRPLESPLGNCALWVQNRDGKIRFIIAPPLQKLQEGKRSLDEEEG